MVHLIPVVKFSPWVFSQQPRETPFVTSVEAWDKYWRDCLADSGIYDLDPIQPGSCHVSVSQLVRPKTLRALVSNALKGIEECQWSLNTISALLGGYFFCADNHQIEPGCCGDLGNIEEWRDASQHQSSDWKLVWIGHPWTYVAAHGEMLTFTELTEESPPVSPNSLVNVTRTDLIAAIDNAEVALKQLSKRLVPFVDELKPTVPIHDVVQLLVWGY